MKELGWGIVGCGAISPWFIHGINKAKGTELIAICDVNEEKAKKLTEKEKVPWYTDYDKMLGRDDINIVGICSSNSSHCELTIAAARARKHVLVEKPMATTLQDADRMIESCEKAKVRLGVISQDRFSDEFKKVKKAITDGELGRLVLGSAYLKYCRTQDFYDSTDWRGYWDSDGGGALINQGIHGVDILQWLMGGIDSSYGYIDTLTHIMEVEDTAVAVLRFRNRALGTIEVTTSAYPPTIPPPYRNSRRKGYYNCRRRSNS